MIKKCFYFLLFLAFVNRSQAQNIQQALQQYIDSIYAANSEAVGFLVHIEAPDQHLFWSYAVGYSNRDTHKKLLVNQPVLIASNTKPYVAATILRLAEQNKIRIDQPIIECLSSKTEKILSAAGYNTQSITLKHLLSHTSGIRDYVDESYFKFIDAHKKYEWTRDEQIRRAAKTGKPLAEPGDTFRYADINYLLLTEVIEQSTKMPFYTAMRRLLDYQKLHLQETWFTKLEKTPAKAAPRAHQYWDEYSWDTYELDPSWDLYGGGGMVATVKDMALFFQDLFNGKVIQNKNVLEMLYQDVPPNLEINYCLGIRKIHIAGLTGYNHGGGLGTDVVYLPKLHATISVVALEAAHRPVALEIRNEIARQLSLLP